MVFDADGYPDIEYLHSLHCTELPAAFVPVRVTTSRKFRIFVVTGFQNGGTITVIFLVGHRRGYARSRRPLWHTSGRLDSG